MRWRRILAKIPLGGNVYRLPCGVPAGRAHPHTHSAMGVAGMQEVGEGEGGSPIAESVCSVRRVWAIPYPHPFPILPPQNLEC